MFVDLRSVWAAVASFRCTRQTLGRPAGCTTLTVSGRNQSILTNVYASIPPQARSVLTRWYGPCAVSGPGQLFAVRCPRTGQTSDYRSAMLLLWWCPSVISYNVLLCNHTSPGTQKLWFPGSCPPSHLKNFGGSLAGIVYG